MALTLAQRTQLRIRAAKEAAATAPAANMAGANSYELQLAQLAQHRARLKQVQSNQGKAELKALLLPEYEPYVQGVLAAGNGAQDEVLTTLMLWRIDAADYPGALAIAEYVIQHNLKMPDRFERTTGTLIAEEIAEAALKAQKAGDSFPLAILEEAARITAEQDMPDQARAKLHLAIGKAYGLLVDAETSQELDPINLKAAQVHLSRAIDLHSNCGGKKDLERVDRLLKKHAEPATPPAS
ncbi:phage terminase small subunit [Pseudomonas leptonychotis]|uniref:Terminase n=1 Tax=Pseudomonas leptonychotis TaxID=2448482 RepID=A0A4T2A3H3_9PSED|nr:phage terminase small subunit [Pseudomonas leptonychotis]TIH10842.1 terminase [Pseudomonas leptonychotis]